MSKRLTEEEYDRRIAKFNKVKRAGPFIDTQTKIKHFCLTHKETHLSWPRGILKGCGLSCCARERSKKAKEDFDKKISLHGRVKRIGEYIRHDVKIKFLCLSHNEIHLATPSCILQGGGLACCKSNKISNERAAREFDNKIKKFGRVVRIGEYINNSTLIQFKCLKHNEVHMSRPGSILTGMGLACCRVSGGDSLLSFLKGNRERIKNNCIYLYELKNYEGYLKLGITNNLSRRTDKGYGEEVCIWYRDSRLECYCIEQACLIDTMLTRSCPLEIRKTKWDGWTEIINSPERVAIDIIQFYWDEMDRLGPYQFALDYLNPTSEETELLKEKLDQSKDVLE